MKILWVPQLSFIDKRTNEFLLDSDSNMHFLRRLLPVLHDTFKEWKIDLVIPEHLDSTEFRFPGYLCKIKNSKVFTPDAFLGRVFFPIDEWKKIINLTEPDILWLNTPELVQQFTTLREKLNKKFKIITYHHWVDLIDVPRVPEAMSYIWRETEGGYKSDVTLFNSKFIMNKFFDSTTAFFGNTITNKIAAKTFPLYIPWQYTKMSKSLKIDLSLVHIIWTQRLSENPFYAQDREFWWKIFREHKDRISIALSNPSGFNIKKSSNILKGLNVTEIGPWSYNDLLIKLRNADLSFGPTGSPIQWSLNVTDSLEMNTPSFVIYKDAIIEMLESYYPFAASNQTELSNIIRALFNNYNTIYELRKMSNHLSHYFAFDNSTIKKQLMSIIEKVT